MHNTRTVEPSSRQRQDLYQSSRQRRRREICELIASPWWDALDPERQDNWLNQLRELCR